MTDGAPAASHERSTAALSNASRPQLPYALRLLPVAILAAIAIAAVGLTLLIRVPAPLPLNCVEEFTRLAAADLAERIPLYAGLERTVALAQGRSTEHR